MKFTPEDITYLESNQIFVFGSNLMGKHGKGAALTAKKKFGAIEGQGEGLQGQSYGIATKNYDLRKAASLTEILQRIIVFIEFAYNNPNLEFLVTKIGTGLAGYSTEDIKWLFESYHLTKNIPNNVILPKEFEFRF